MRRRDILGCTLTYLLNALDSSDPNDPHAGNLPLEYIEDLL